MLPPYCAASALYILLTICQAVLSLESIVSVICFAIFHNKYKRNYCYASIIMTKIIKKVNARFKVFTFVGILLFKNSNVIIHNRWINDSTGYICEPYFNSIC